MVFLCIISLSISMLFPESKTRGLLRSHNISPNDIYSNQWALIIGINQYSDYDKLKYAVEDAKSIETTLKTQYGFPEENITLLIDNEATKDKIQNAFYDLSEKTQSNDAVVIFFAGHGITRKIPGTNEDLGYLVPIDGKQKSLTRTTISMNDINTFSNEIPAKSVLFLVDACYGGLAAVGQYRANRGDLDIVKGLTKDRSRQIITAGKKNEEVIEDEKWEHSAFTHILMKGLMELQADTDKDGIILANQLYSFIHSNVLKLTGGNQTPVFSKLTNDGGEFAFIDQSIISDLYDMDVTGFGFLTIPSEPFDALIKIDDLLIDKKTPLINEQLNSGPHTITIFKKGYRDKSVRIFIKPNVNNIITPTMNLIEGIVSFANLPRYSKVTLNGKSIGTAPIENIVLEKGSHTVEIQIPGYEKLPPIDLNIKDSKVYPLTLPRLVPKTTMNALLRSAIIPGWGQNYYEKPTKSIGFGTTAILSALFCIYNEFQYRNLSEDYNQALENYHNSGTDLDIKATQMLTIYGQLEVNEKNTNMGAYVFGGIYVMNLIDILLEKPFASSSSFSESTIESHVKVGITPSGPGIKIGIHF